MPLFISKTVTPCRLGFSIPATSFTERGSDAGSKEAELASVRTISACRLLEWAFARRLYAECRDSGIFFRVIDAMGGAYATKMVATR